MADICLYVSDMGMQGSRNSAERPDASEFWLDVPCCWVIQVDNPALIARNNI